MSSRILHCKPPFLEMRFIPSDTILHNSDWYNKLSNLVKIATGVHKCMVSINIQYNFKPIIWYIHRQNYILYNVMSSFQNFLSLK